MIFHFGDLRPVVPLGILESTAFYSGNYPIEYGDATAGLIAVTTKSEPVPRLTGYLDVNWADLSAVLSVPLKKKRRMSLTLSGQFSMLDRVLNEALPHNGTVSIDNLPRYWDAQLSWIYRPAPSLRLKFLALASHDDLVDWFGNTSYGEPAQGTYVLKTQFYRGIVSAEWNPSERFSSQIVLGGGLDKTEQHSPEYDVNLLKLQVRPSLRARLWRQLWLNFGVDYLAEQLRDSSLAESAAPNSTTSSGTIQLNKHSSHLVGAYLAFDWLLWKRLQLLPGLRVSYSTLAKETLVDPRIVVRLDLLKGRKGAANVAIKVAIGGYHQPPSLLQSSSQIGNPSLSAESSIHYLWGLEYRPIRQLMIDLAGFWVTENDVIVRTSSTTTRNGTPVPQVFNNQGSGKTRGVELFIRQELWKGLEGFLYYTYSVSDLSSASGQAETTSSYDQTHVFGAMLSYLFPRGFKLRARFQYATGFPTTGIVDSIFNSSSNQFQSISGTTLGDRIPDFSQLDLRLDKIWTLKWATISAYLDVRNVYNRKNVVTSYSYNYDYSQRYARTGIPILPMFGMRADF